jgi:hypothetical protein
MTDAIPGILAIVLQDRYDRTSVACDAHDLILRKAAQLSRVGDHDRPLRLAAAG